MPIRDFKCDSCGLEQERVYAQTALRVVASNHEETLRKEADPTFPPCESCGGTLTVLPLSQPSRRFVGSVFPFVTNHIDPQGKPMTIESLGHLRQVEKSYGVVLPAFSKSNIHDVDPIENPPVYKGWEADFERRRR